MSAHHAREKHVGRVGALSPRSTFDALDLLFCAFCYVAQQLEEGEELNALRCVSRADYNDLIARRSCGQGLNRNPRTSFGECH